MIKGNGRWIAVLLVGAIASGLLVSWLLYPAPIVKRRVSVPQLHGTPTAQAVAELAAVGLRGRNAGEIEDPLAPSGTVSWQSPVVGTELPEGGIVRLGISVGPPRVLVPDLVELDLRSARTILEAAGLGVGTLDSAWSAAPIGAVVRTRPEARGALRAGGTVDVTVSRGPRRPRR